MRIVALSQAKTHLGSLLTEVDELGEEITITRSGRPVAVLLSQSEHEGLLETLEILADRDFLREIERGIDEASKGDLLSHEDVWDGLEDRIHR